MRVLGLISGTSHDGIDYAAVNFTLEGDVLEATIEHIGRVPYSPELRASLISALPPAQVDLQAVTALDTRIGQEFAAAAHTAIATSPVDLICSHGQTVYHWVRENRVEGTLQLGQPAWITERTGLPVFSDLRSRDIANGGQGAPLVPILDTMLFAEKPGSHAVLNLGGISNVTITKPASDPIAYDIGPANALIDAAVSMRGAHPGGFDEDGRLASAGTVHQGLLDALLAEPYYAAPAPKSTGKELFNASYVEEMLHRAGDRLSTEDLVATLTELTVRTVVDQLSSKDLGTMVVSGGGAENPVMMAALRGALPETQVVRAEHYGIPSDAKEAVAFALIGWLGWHGLPGTVATATGANQARILGSLSPGDQPLRLPEPLPTMPRALRIRAGRNRTAPVEMRPAEKDDRSDIVQVFLDCWSISYRGVLPTELVGKMDRERAESLWATSLDDPAVETVVALHQGGIAGVTRFTVEEDGRGHVGALYVSPQAQGAGIGSALLESAVSTLAERGAQSVTLWVFEDNHPSLTFYRKHGWRPDGERLTDPAFGQPQIRLTRRLT